VLVHVPARTVLSSAGQLAAMGQSSCCVSAEPPEDRCTIQQHKHLKLAHSSTIYVFGAGGVGCAVNGAYCESAMFNQRPKYTKQGDRAIIFFDKYWKINIVDDTDSWVYSFPDANQHWPPAERWTTSGYEKGDAEPPPDVTDQEPPDHILKHTQSHHDHEKHKKKHHDDDDDEHKKKHHEEEEHGKITQEEEIIETVIDGDGEEHQVVEIVELEFDALLNQIGSHVVSVHDVVEEAPVEHKATGHGHGHVKKGKGKSHGHGHEAPVEHEAKGHGKGKSHGHGHKAPV